MKKTLWNIIEETLQKIGRPLSAEEIWLEAERTGVTENFTSTSKMPWHTVGAYCLTDINNNGENSEFVLVDGKPQKFFLRKFLKNENNCGVVTESEIINFEKKELNIVAPQSEISAEEFELLAKLADTVAREGMIIVEIGSWSGMGSTKALAEIVKRNNGKLICIDTWKGNEGVEHHRRIVKLYDVFSFFLDAVRIQGFNDCIVPIRTDSAFASNIMTENFADMIFIDGDHRYNPLYRDIINMRPKLKKGGIICGHDFEKSWEKISVDFNEEDFEKCMINDVYKNYHCGVSKALFEIFGESFSYERNGSKIWYKLE